VGGAGVTLRVRRDRLLGRLPQAREEESQGTDRALQVFLAVGVRLAAAVFLFYTAKTPAETTLYLPFLKNFACRWARVVHRARRIS
jgi:hypothetical protein